MARASGIETSPWSANRSPLRWIALAVREVIAVSLWTFAFVKLFVYDIDVSLFDTYAPTLVRFLSYRFFFIIATIALSWLVLGDRKFRVVVAYVLFYPLVIVLWRIPKLALRNWAAAIVFAPALESLIRTLKLRFTIASFALVSGLVIVVLSHRYPMVIAITILLVYLVAHYVLRFRIMFQPSSAFTDIGRLMKDAWRSILTNFKEKDLRDAALLDPASEEYRKKHLTTLQTLFFLNLICAFCANKLREVVESRKTDLYFLWALFYTCALTVVIFAIVYLALHKIDAESFSPVGAVSFWLFLSFSFNTIIHTSLASISPVSSPAKILAHVELLASLVIFVGFVFTYLTSNRERYRQDLTTLIEQLGTDARQIAGFIESEFSISIVEAEAQLVREVPEFSKTIELLGGNSSNAKGRYAG